MWAPSQISFVRLCTTPGSQPVDQRKMVVLPTQSSVSLGRGKMGLRAAQRRAPEVGGAIARSHERLTGRLPDSGRVDLCVAPTAWGQQKKRVTAASFLCGTVTRVSASQQSRRLLRRQLHPAARACSCLRWTCIRSSVAAVEFTARNFSHTPQVLPDPIQQAVIKNSLCQSRRTVVSRICAAVAGCGLLPISRLGCLSLKELLHFADSRPLKLPKFKRLLPAQRKQHQTSSFTKSLMHPQLRTCHLLEFVHLLPRHDKHEWDFLLTQDTQVLASA